MPPKRQRKGVSISSKHSQRPERDEQRTATDVFECRELRVPHLFPPKPGQTMSLSRHVVLQLRVRPLYRDKVFVIMNFLTEEECAGWKSFCDKADFQDTMHAATKDMAFRDNGRIEMWDAKVADVIWARLRSFVPSAVDGMRAVGCYEKIRIYRYRAGGQRFGKHVDESTVGTLENTRTAITVLIYLNGAQSGLRGGETVFYRGTGNVEATRFEPTAGALLFHG